MSRRPPQGPVGNRRPSLPASSCHDVVEVLLGPTNCVNTSPMGSDDTEQPGSVFSDGCSRHRPAASGPSVFSIGPVKRASDQEARWAGTFRRTPDIRRSSNG